MEWLLLDSTVVRAHQHAADKKGQRTEALGRSHGGFSTKVNVGVDALGNPVRLQLTPTKPQTFRQAPPCWRA